VIVGAGKHRHGGPSRHKWHEKDVSGFVFCRFFALVCSIILPFPPCSLMKVFVLSTIIFVHNKHSPGHNCPIVLEVTINGCPNSSNNLTFIPSNNHRDSSTKQEMAFL